MSGVYVPSLPQERVALWSKRMGFKYYVLRIGCFGIMLYFTFVSPMVSASILSGVCLGVLFYRDFF